MFYDFGGLTGTPTYIPSASSLAITTPPTGPVPPNSLVLGPDTTVLNVAMFHNSGNSYSNNPGMSIALGRLDVIFSNTIAPTPNVAFADNSFDADNGAPAGNQSFVRGPLPEPATACLAIAVAGVLGLRRPGRQL